MLNDESDFGKIIVRRMEQMVRVCTRDSRLPSCEQEEVEGETIDVSALWRLMKELLDGMAVEGCKLSALDRLRRMLKNKGETALHLVHKAQMIFLTSEVPV